MRNFGTGCTSVTSRPPALLADAKIRLPPLRLASGAPGIRAKNVLSSSTLTAFSVIVDTVSCSSSGVCALAACCTLTPVRSRWTSPPEATMYESRALSRVAQGPRTCF